MSFAPLRGLVVADFTGTVPGPLCTQTLRQLGAEVWKVEAPGGGDVARPYGFFEYLNQGKQQLILDLKSADGVSAARELISRADVLVEGFRPGVMERFGLSHADLSHELPDLIYCSISGTGQTGSTRNDPGHDVNYLAAAGVLNRHRDHKGDLIGAPLPAPVADVTAALLAVVGILAALEERRRTGAGRYVDVSLLDASLLLGSTDLVDALGRGADRALPPGSEVPHYGLFETRDGRAISLGIMPFEETFWHEFCDIASIDSKWRNMPPSERLERAGELRSLLREVISDDDYQVWCGRLRGSNVAWAPVRNADEVVQEFGQSAPGLPGSDIPIGVRGSMDRKETSGEY